MGIYVRSFEHIYQAIEEVPPKGRLFAFLLADNRASNQSLFEFINSNDTFIDELSASSNIFTFIPFSKWTDHDRNPGFMIGEQPYRRLKAEEKEFALTIEKKEFSLNLSLEIARKFGIKPRNLPGIVFFKQFPKSVPEDPIYVSLPKIVLTDSTAFEKVIIEVYSIVQDAWDRDNKILNVLEHLKMVFGEESIADHITQPIENSHDMFDEVVKKTTIIEQSIGEFEFLSSDEKSRIQIFISYAKEDIDFANFLYRRLDSAGFAPWIDYMNIRAGSLWEKTIERGLKESMFFIAILSEQSVSKRGYLQKEFKHALEKWKEFLDDDIYIIPIRIDKCEIPESLRQFQWVDFYTEPDKELNYQGYPYESKGTWIKIMQSVTEGARKRNLNSRPLT